jgi:potassium efflux system protein
MLALPHSPRPTMEPLCSTATRSPFSSKALRISVKEDGDASSVNSRSCPLRITFILRQLTILATLLARSNSKLPLFAWRLATLKVVKMECIAKIKQAKGTHAAVNRSSIQRKLSKALALRNAAVLRFPRHLAPCVFVLLFACLTTAGAHGQLKLPGQPQPPAPVSAQPAAPAPTAPVELQPIPLPQIADRADALDLTLQEITRGLTTEDDKTTPDSPLSVPPAEITERARQADGFIGGGPDIVQIREEIVYWRNLSRAATDQRRQLTERADQLQSQIGLLAQQQEIWQATRDSIHDTKGIEVVAERVQRELDAIRDLRVRAQVQLNQLLTQQNQLSETGRRASETLGKLTEAETRFRGSVFDQDGAPLWSGKAFADSGQSTGVLIRGVARQEYSSAQDFFRAHGSAIVLLPLLYGLALAAAFQIRRHLAVWKGPVLPDAAHRIFSRPASVALMAVLLSSLAWTQSAPVSVAATIYLIWICLLASLAPLLISPELRPPLYLLLTLSVIEVVRALVPIGSGIRRFVLTLATLALLAAFGWLTRPSKLRELPLSKWPRLVFLIGTRGGLVLIAVAMVANIFGFVSLARVLGVGTLLSAFFATVLYCVVRVALLSLEILLESRWAIYLTPDIREGIRVWGRRILILIAVLLWWSRSQIYLYLLQESVRSASATFLDANIGIGSIHFTLRNVLIVLLILAIGFALAKTLSSIVRSVLVAKFPLQRGMPYAASKVTYYILSLLVVVAAVSAAGIDLNKFTVITGAVGVGIGFGLQDIVKNFASGLILLFERPIRVDDTVELTGLIGTVKRIGARSSTLVTGQGAEVIVPNSNLVSAQVINWTLSSPQRRIEIPVGVAYGTDPAQVLALLTGVAADHKGVLPLPAPAAYFMGFGDSALNFELRFWSANQDIWFQLKSDVTVAMAKALTDAGIEIPFPQSDLHLRSVDPSILNGSLPAELANLADPNHAESPGRASSHRQQPKPNE